MGVPDGAGEARSLAGRRRDGAARGGSRRAALPARRPVAHRGPDAGAVRHQRGGERGARDGDRVRAGTGSPSPGARAATAGRRCPSSSRPCMRACGSPSRTAASATSRPRGRTSPAVGTRTWRSSRIGWRAACRHRRPMPILSGPRTGHVSHARAGCGGLEHASRRTPPGHPPNPGSRARWIGSDSSNTWTGTLVQTGVTDRAPRGDPRASSCGRCSRGPRRRTAPAPPPFGGCREPARRRRSSRASRAPPRGPTCPAPGRACVRAGGGRRRSRASVSPRVRCRTDRLSMPRGTVGAMERS